MQGIGELSAKETAPSILVACEFSGTVRDAFAAKGWDAWSCDLLPTESPGNHIQGDVKDYLNGIELDTWGGVEFCDLSAKDKEAANGNYLARDYKTWDMMIAHPPCTFLTVAANKWMNHPKYPNRAADRKLAIEFFMDLWNAPIDRIWIENPIGVMSTNFRKPDQVVQPWMFGHPETKATCFWLRGLPLLAASHLKNDLFAEKEPEGREQRLHRLPPSPTRWKERSKTYQGIADAMADQWGAL